MSRRRPPLPPTVRKRSCGRSSTWRALLLGRSADVAVRGRRHRHRRGRRREHRLDHLVDRHDVGLDGDAAAPPWCAAASATRLAPSAVVHVQNDVDAHALGELRHGAAVGARSALVVAVGTGVGAGIIVDGRALRGARHVAGEIGHVPTPGAEHLLCPCGRRGHLEAIGSGVGMHRHYLSLGGDPAVTDARGIVGARARRRPARSACDRGFGLRRGTGDRGCGDAPRSRARRRDRAASRRSATPGGRR